MAQTSSSGTITLDEHTRPFFDPKWHTGPSEIRFSILAPGLENRRFAARLARLLTGEWVAVLQELPRTIYGADQMATDELSNFVAFLVGGAPKNDSPSPKEIREFWDGVIANQGDIIRGGEVILDETMGDSLARLHFDTATRLGCFIGTEGYVRFLNVREATLAPGEVYFFPVHIESLVFDVRQLSTMKSADFHSRLDALFRDVERSTDFHLLDEDARGRKLLNASGETRGRANDMFQVLLAIAMGPDGELEGMAEVRWVAWGDEWVGVEMATGDSVRGDVPDSLRQGQDEVFELLGCHRIQHRPGVLSDGEAVAKGLEMEWVYRHICFSQEDEKRLTSGHDVAVAYSRLDEMKERAKAEMER